VVGRLDGSFTGTLRPPGKGTPPHPRIRGLSRPTEPFHSQMLGRVLRKTSMVRSGGRAGSSSESSSTRARDRTARCSRGVRAPLPLGRPSSHRSMSRRRCTPGAKRPFPMGAAGRRPRLVPPLSKCTAPPAPPLPFAPLGVCRSCIVGHLDHCRRVDALHRQQLFGRVGGGRRRSCSLASGRAPAPLTSTVTAWARAG